MREKAFQARGWTAGTDAEEKPREGCTAGIFSLAGGTERGQTA